LNERETIIIFILKPYFQKETSKQTSIEKIEVFEGKKGKSKETLNFHEIEKN